MLDGRYSGTMALTEPGQGSALGDIRTTARPAEDGSYRVFGQKMFISGGDHELFCIQRLRVQGHFERRVAANLAGGRAGTQRDPGVAAFGKQHVDKGARGSVAEQLPQLLFVPGDTVLVDQRDEIARGVTGQCGLGEVRVGRQKAAGADVEVRKVAASAAGDQDLLPGPVRALDEEDAAAALPRLDRAHEAGGSGAGDDDVEASRISHSWNAGRGR